MRHELGLSPVWGKAQVWSHNMWEYFKGGDYPSLWESPRPTDLCTLGRLFMKVAFAYGFNAAVIAWSLISVSYFAYAIGTVASSLFSFILFFVGVIGVAVVAIGTGVALIWSMTKLPNTEVGKVVKTYVKSKKEGICPTISFKGDGQ